MERELRCLNKVTMQEKHIHYCICICIYVPVYICMQLDISYVKFLNIKPAILSEGLELAQKTGSVL